MQEMQDTGPTPGLGRSSGEGNGNPTLGCLKNPTDKVLQYCYLKYPMDKEAWQAIVHWATTSWTQVNDWAHHN